MTKLVTSIQELVHRRDVHGFFDDLEWYVSGHRWNNLAADSGSSVAAVDAAGGKARLTTGGTDNNEAHLYCNQETFLFAANKPIVFECSALWNEVASNESNFACGLVNAAGSADLIVNGGGMKASFSGAVIHKKDGEALLRVKCSVGTTNVETLTNEAITAAATQNSRFRIEVTPINSTQAEVVYSIDEDQTGNWRQLRDSSNVPIKHTFTYTSATEMHPFVAVKAGTTTSVVCDVDYVACFQER